MSGYSSSTTALRDSHRCSFRRDFQLLHIHPYG
jgi:hypothetical protein